MQISHKILLIQVYHILKFQSCSDHYFEQWFGLTTFHDIWYLYCCTNGRKTHAELILCAMMTISCPTTSKKWPTGFKCGDYGGHLSTVNLLI